MLKRSKKLLVGLPTIVITCAGAMALVPTVQASAQDNGVTITVWTWPDNDKTFAKTIPVFEKLYPNVHVKVQAFSGTDYSTKLLASLVTGTGPDVAMVEIGSVAEFKSKPGFVDLSQPPYSARRFSQNYAPFAWKYVSDGKTGKIFALPKNTGPGGMFYRRDLFAAAGLPTDPVKVHQLLATWQDYINVGKKLTRPGKQWMVSMPDEIFGTARSESGVSNFDSNGKLLMTTPQATAALTLAQQAYKAGITSPIADWSPEWAAGLKNGAFATVLMGNWMGGLLKSTYASTTSGKWGVTYAPSYEGKSAYDSGGDFIGILQTSQHKTEAWDFIQFVTQNPDSLRIMYQANDLFPAWLPALKSSWLNESDSFYAGEDVGAVFAKVNKDMKAPLTNPNDPVVSQVWSNVLINATKGHMNVKDAINKGVAQAQSKLGQ